GRRVLTFRLGFGRGTLILRQFLLVLSARLGEVLFELLPVGGQWLFARVGFKQLAGGPGLARRGTPPGVGQGDRGAPGLVKPAGQRSLPPPRTGRPSRASKPPSGLENRPGAAACRAWER